MIRDGQAKSLQLPYRFSILSVLPQVHQQELLHNLHGFEACSQSQLRYERELRTYGVTWGPAAGYRPSSFAFFISYFVFCTCTGSSRFSRYETNNVMYGAYSTSVLSLVSTTHSYSHMEEEQTMTSRDTAWQSTAAVENCEHPEAGTITTLLHYPYVSGGHAICSLTGASVLYVQVQYMCSTGGGS